MPGNTFKKKQAYLAVNKTTGPCSLSEASGLVRRTDV